MTQYKGTLPGAPVDAQIFVIGDIHGQAKTLEKALQLIHDAPRTGKPTRLIFIGDIMDRGPENLRSVDLVMNAAALAQVDQVTFLPGNHELMLVMASVPGPNQGEIMTWWGHNGGFKVMRELFPDMGTVTTGEISKKLNETFSDFIDLINAAPNALKIDDLLFVHAGIVPDCDIDASISQPRYDQNIEHWAWVREPFLTHKGGWDPERKITVIHGHTPQNLGQKIDPAYIGAFFDTVESSNRICLDAGATQMGQLLVLTISEACYTLDLVQEVPFDPKLETCVTPEMFEKQNSPELG